MKAHTSRRRLLAGLAASPLLTGPALAAGPHPDAAILDAEPGFLAAHQAAEEAWVAYTAAVAEARRKVGLPLDAAGVDHDVLPAQLDAFLSDPAEEEAEAAWDAACDAMTGHAEAIIATPARTLDGLMAKARCLRTAALDDHDDNLKGIVTDLLAIGAMNGDAA